MNLNPVERSYDPWIAPIIRDEARDYMARIIPISIEATKRYTNRTGVAFEQYPRQYSSLDLSNLSLRELDELVDRELGLRTNDENNQMNVNLGLCNRLADNIPDGLQVNFGRVGESWWDHNFAAFATGGVQINYGSVGGYFGWHAKGGIQINLGRVYGCWDEDRFMQCLDGMGSSSSISLNLGELVMPDEKQKQHMAPRNGSGLGEIFTKLLRLREPSTPFEDAVKACMDIMDYQKFELQLLGAINEYKRSHGLGNETYFLNFGSIFEDRASMFASHKK